MTTSELAPLDPLPFTGLYAVTKGALDKYAYSLRMELQLLDIPVSVLRAGAVKTKMLDVSTDALDRFCEKTALYTCNAKRFRNIVNRVEARCVPPEKIAAKTLKILKNVNQSSHMRSIAIRFFCFLTFCRSVSSFLRSAWFCVHETKGEDKVKLVISALVKFLLGVLLVGLLLFLPAGSLWFVNAWLFIGLLFFPMLVLGIVMLVKSPALLAKRLNAKEKEETQRWVVAVSGLLFFAGFLVAGFDFRFGWSHVPLWLVVIASVILLVSYALYAEVMRENAYLSRTVEVQEGQKVVDTGLYGIVRHPMYAVTVWLFLSIPIVLGSFWSLLCFLPYVAVIAVRIGNEEKVLEAGLDGYTEYKKRVKYRIVPFVW